MSTCCFPPFSIASSSKLMVTCSHAHMLNAVSWPLSLFVASYQDPITDSIPLACWECCHSSCARSKRAGADPGGHDLALLDHLGHHVAVGRPGLHVRPQQVPRAQMQQPKVLHQLRALRAPHRLRTSLTQFGAISHSANGLKKPKLLHQLCALQASHHLTAALTENTNRVCTISATPCSSRHQSTW